jgi:alpha-soluble NSF attachment protein
MSAKYYKEIALLYEDDLDISNAIHYYEIEIDLLDKQNKPFEFTNLLNKVANLYCNINEYEKAGKLFERCVDYKNKFDIGKYLLKENIINCLLCYLATEDIVLTIMNLDRFKNLDYTFSTSRECKFIEDIIKCIETMNEEQFSSVCEMFDMITPLNPLRIQTLLSIKNIIHKNEIDLS